MTDDNEELRNSILDELGIATRKEIDADTRRVYLTSLVRWDIPTLAEACSRLMQSAKFFPTLSEINEVCGIVRKESNADESEELYSRREWLPPARAKLWMDHLRETIEALKTGRPRPEPPEPLDSSTATYKCGECQDTGFIQACHCGRKDCNLCRYRYVKDCFCRPVREVKPSFTRNARAR